MSRNIVLAGCLAILCLCGVSSDLLGEDRRERSSQGAMAAIVEKGEASPISGLAIGGSPEGGEPFDFQAASEGSVGGWWLSDGDAVRALSCFEGCEPLAKAERQRGEDLLTEERGRGSQALALLRAQCDEMVALASSRPEEPIWMERWFIATGAISLGVAVGIAVGLTAF